MSEYVQTELTPSIEVGRKGGQLIAACVCGSGLTVLDKGLNRASLAAWRTRHQTCRADQQAGNQ